MLGYGIRVIKLIVCFLFLQLSVENYVIVTCIESLFNLDLFYCKLMKLCVIHNNVFIPRNVRFCLELFSCCKGKQICLPINALFGHTY